jgi:selenobiotic family peptide radical SAM maturase
MTRYEKKANKEVYAACCKIVGPEKWKKFISSFDAAPDPDILNDLIEKTGDFTAYPFLPDLARLEWTVNAVSKSSSTIPTQKGHLSVNPTLHILLLSWKNLTAFLGNTNPNTYAAVPEPGKETVIIWKDPGTGSMHYRSASDRDLLALKIVAEDISSEKAAREGLVSVSFIEAVLNEAIKEHLLISPDAFLKRNPEIFSANEYAGEKYLVSQSFTLQWHITQACDLHCRHCYDRSTRPPMKMERALRVLDDLEGFCRKRRVEGAISLTGGNPLLYPNFRELYREAASRGFYLGILGNPSSRKEMESLVTIHKPSYFQLSLEGLEEHNDLIRGAGHFQKVIDFLGILRDLNIFSMVMLTLTDKNIHQVIPLAELLRAHADRFHFNRLSMVGEGSNLRLPDKHTYITFLESYLVAAEHNPVIGLKDNMLSILMYRNGRMPFGGCTTFGCGAAFNFLALLSDGEVHACRKFPSLLGNVFQNPLDEIYDSDLARSYRSGSDACRLCTIRPVCGGCPAVTAGHGMSIFTEKDPYCFINE